MGQVDDTPIIGALRCLLPPGAAASIWQGVHEPPLWPEEQDFVRHASPKRRSEFQRGRACARHALSLLGVPPGPIPAGPDRAPVWPEGFVGSITHCSGLVAAAVAPVRKIYALGLDAEPAHPLPSETRPLILHPSEMSSATDDLLETVIFSAKETVHKALFPLSCVWMDFLDVIIGLDPTCMRFTAKVAPSARATAVGLAELQGTFRVARGFVLTLSYLLGEPTGSHSYLTDHATHLSAGR